MVIESGREVQQQVYGTPDNPWPVGPDEWEQRAREAIDRGAFDYIAGGAAQEWTVRANREAFDRWRLRPAMLRGNDTRDMAVEILGMRCAVPFLIAPIGVQEIAHPDGDLAVARAAAATATPMVVSSAASYSMEDIAGELGTAPAWYQLYWVSDREVVASLVHRAQAAGYRGIIVTLDTLTLGWRDRDLRNAYLPFLQGRGVAQFISDPVFRDRLGFDPADMPAAAGAQFVGMYPNLALTWGDLEWLRAQTTLPILLKGILRGDDALRARDAGAQGVIVSNHGGRQVDGAIAALDALIEVREALGEDFPVLMDSGIRRGADVAKALCLGADAVLLGRPYMYGLAVGGQQGVEQVLRTFAAELDLTLALLGVRSPEELDRTWVAPRP